ncbi:MAG: dienelactone hydrolase family protein [Candidatus Diapherotrites archaeon]|nr:dienelactone hydrolase family protein [Candidatus Diapherotrites archaeon]
MAVRLAEHGFVVLAVDLFGGRVTQSPDEARGLVFGLDQQVALKNLKAAVSFLRGEHQVLWIASLGWCFGGGQSLQLSLSGEQLDATVIYYGNLEI